VAPSPRILAFAGSTRDGSFNKRLLKVGVAAAQAAGAEVTAIDLRDYPMPLYDGDLEQREGLPEPAKRFKDLMLSHQAFLISSPEYNSGPSGVLKNAIDWASRGDPPGTSLVAFRGKVAGLLSASTGALGGLRGLVHVRSILSSIDVLVIPEQFSLSKAHEAFDDATGALKDPKSEASVRRVAERLATVLRKLSAE
jgi:chromate reductase, NAD(P)H dehydrogenase (quinone)